ncbi:glutamate dehydrogenase/leucine dehydrogenase [Amaricoccus macauensis]|uniref:Glutamate dehydrogenase/leucine dehydrogenase n=1 Tax=Amaricoccus macauensis TaxID=57001 RepID=A0A840SRS4_9RHOB|nr:glutamate dehydrogenase [Amaricoccus macauensis]MBB5221922.1 glutamate dehydrogenase/leucine dehydrogenase [Amaricoccus macauensis]
MYSGPVFDMAKTQFHGIADHLEIPMDLLGIEPAGSTAIVQGFGNVGSVAAFELAGHGVKIVGVSDHTGAYADPRGFDITGPKAFIETHGTLAGFCKKAEVDPEEMLTLPCDVLVPAAMERAITAENAGRIQCRVLAEGANGPTTPEADAIIAGRNRDIFVPPDILCNAGGVIVSYFEWVRDLQQYFWDETEVNSGLYSALDRSLAQVLARAKAEGLSNRNAALAIGIDQRARRRRHPGPTKTGMARALAQPEMAAGPGVAPFQSRWDR